MKNWIKKLQISFAADEGRMPSESVRRAVARNAELQEFASSLTALEDMLRKAVPKGDASDLRRAVMRAVRNADREAVNVVARWRTRTAGFAVAALMVLMAAVIAYNAAGPRNSGEAVQVSEMPAARLVSDSPDLARMSSETLSPLQRELEAVHRDLRAAGEFLLASVP